MSVGADPSPGTDFYLLDELLTEDERAIRDRVRAFCDQEVVPVINGYWDRSEFPFELLPKLAGLHVAGGAVRGYGCPGMSAVASGMVNLELARGDGSVSTFYTVHSCLAMNSIAMLGSEEQKQRWLPPMARMEKIGAFALTEPQHGSDVAALETRARCDGDGYLLDGSKRWIGNASIADVTVVWARDDEGNVGGFLVEKDTPGFHARVIQGKTSERAVWQADVRLEQAWVPAENRLAGSLTFRDTARVLRTSRYGVAWEAAGHAVAAYEAALAYSRQRIQFGKPLAAFQIIQNKLARMLADVTSLQLLCLRLGQLAAEDRLTDGMVSLAKMNNCLKSRQALADARDILGGNGILLEYHVARHQADMEAVYTYEGTDTIQSLIVGREITGVKAFTGR